MALLPLAASVKICYQPQPTPKAIGTLAGANITNVRPGSSSTQLQTFPISAGCHRQLCCVITSTV